MIKWIKSLVLEESRLCSLWGVSTYIAPVTKLFFAGFWLGIAALVGPIEATVTIGTLIFLFSFVVLHEYGHAYMALKFGYPCRRITMYPIGGVLQLEVTPYDYPWAELCITAAGPLVNVCLIPICYCIFLFSPESVKPFTSLPLYVNCILVVFNILPLFPMDGGRILRSILGLCGVESISATKVTCYVACGVAPLVMAYYLFVQFSPMILIVIPIMVWAAFGELNLVRELVEKGRATDKWMAEHGFTPEWRQDIRFFAECQDLVYELYPRLKKLPSHERLHFMRLVVKNVAEQPSSKIDIAHLNSLPGSLRSLKTRQIIEQAAEKAIRML